MIMYKNVFAFTIFFYYLIKQILAFHSSYFPHSEKCINTEIIGGKNSRNIPSFVKNLTIPWEISKCRLPSLIVSRHF